MNGGCSSRQHIWLIAIMLILTCALSPLYSEIAFNRIQVMLTLPTYNANPSGFYDQKVTLKVKLVNITNPATNVEVRWALLYDDINTKATRGNIAGFNKLSFAIPGEEKYAESKTLRLTGNKKKTAIQGMKYVGYGLQVLDGEKLIYQQYQPQDLKTEVVEILDAMLASNALLAVTATNVISNSATNGVALTKPVSNAVESVKEVTLADDSGTSKPHDEKKTVLSDTNSSVSDIKESDKKTSLPKENDVTESKSDSEKIEINKPLVPVKSSPPEK